MPNARKKILFYMPVVVSVAERPWRRRSLYQSGHYVVLKDDGGGICRIVA